MQCIDAEFAQPLMKQLINPKEAIMQILTRTEAMKKLAECTSSALEALYVADMNRILGSNSTLTKDKRFVAMYKVTDCMVSDLLENEDNLLVFFWDDGLC